METRKLGYTDLELTKIGLGTWAIGGSWEWGWGPQEEADSIRSIHEAMEVGINWIDTAPIYGCGESELTIGKALRSISQKPFIATKFGLLWDNKRKKFGCLKADSVRKECENSLRRLGVEVIDLYQMHWPDPDEDVEQAWEMVARLVEEGKVRYAGVSNFTVEQIQRCQRIHPVSSLQPPYSMLNRDIEKELLPFCSEHNIGVIVYSPMHKGLLTGKFTPDKIAALPADDHRHKDANFQQPKLNANLKLVEELKEVAYRNNISLAQLSIAWVLREEEVTAAIVGARKPGQIIETAAAGGIDLSREDIDKIEELLNWHEQLII